MTDRPPMNDAAKRPDHHNTAMRRLTIASLLLAADQAGLHLVTGMMLADDRREVTHGN